MLRGGSRHKVIIVKDGETGESPFFNYVLRLAERWFPFAGESSAEGIRNLLVSIGRHGLHGDKIREDTVVLYEASHNEHRIAHGQHPDEPKAIYVVSAYHEDDVQEGRAEAWSLFLRALDLTL